MINETLDAKYKLLRLLGEGGMGSVYEAVREETNERVAIKLIRGALEDTSGDLLRRFRREAKMVGAIETPHIVRMLDTGTDEARSVPYIALEYLNGEDLHSLLKRVDVLPPDVVLRIVGQACVGLQKAHEAHVLHRDIKPANLFLTHLEGGEVQVKLLDFGIAKMQRNSEVKLETTGLTETGVLMGSPLYMSPEQARSLPGIDERTDIWSLGVVLYRALAGRAPHESVTKFGGLIYAICSEPAEPIRRVAPWVSTEIAAIVHRALQIQREERYQSAADLLADIRALLPGGLSLRVTDLVPMDPSQRAELSVRVEVPTVKLGIHNTLRVGAQSVPAPPSTEASGRRFQVRGTLLATVAALALGAGVGGSFLATSPHPKRALVVETTQRARVPIVERVLKEFTTKQPIISPREEAPPSPSASSSTSPETERLSPHVERNPRFKTPPSIPTTMPASTPAAEIPDEMN